MNVPAVCVLAGHGTRAVGSALIAIPAPQGHNVGGDNWVAIAGLWVGVACLIIAIPGPIKWWWVRRTRRAAERAELEERFGMVQLVAIVEDLDAAIVANDPQETRSQLEKWRRQAAFVHGLLTEAKSDMAIICISNSMSLAREASNALIRGESVDSAYIARDAITAARDALITWISRQSKAS